jgi:hypothetical protein
LLGKRGEGGLHKPGPEDPEARACYHATSKWRRFVLSG